MRYGRNMLLIAAECVLGFLGANGQTQMAIVDTESPPQSQSSDSSSSSSSLGHSDGWRLDLTPYLWFAGTHGTVGALGRDASVHASAGDMLSHLNAGLMGAAQAQIGRFLLNGDLLWIRLSDSKALPFPGLNARSADVTVGQLVWTSKIGYRLIERNGVKADANVGVRYWHLGQSLNFNPSIFGLNVNRSQSWADIVVGGRLEFPLGQKASITALGDVGGWNATAKSDYQVAGALNFKVSNRWTISPGYRYLYVDYRSGSSIYNLATSGALIGVTYTVGGNPTK